MLSKAKIKEIRSLEQKKFRNESGFFVAEGEKLVGEIINSKLEIDSLFALPDAHLPHARNSVEVVGEDEMHKISFLKTPSKALAVVKIPNSKCDIEKINSSLSLVLDGVQDPGNLGTIARMADWFGIGNIICSPQTADCFAPKAVQATMGAITRVNFFYTNLPDFFSQVNKNLKIFGTFMNGENIYSTQLPQQALIVMGNEGNGISAEVEKFVNQKLSIPCFSTQKVKPESLNVAVATAIVCSEFRRNLANN